VIKSKNKQWAVTKRGLESVGNASPYRYRIDAREFLKRRGEGKFGDYDWPIHMAEKTWVDLGAFIEAFCLALQHHEGKYPGLVDKNTLESSIRRALELRASFPPRRQASKTQMFRTMAEIE
jgi:hypothetical protein